MAIYIVKNAEYKEFVGRIDWSNFVNEGYINLSSVVANRALCLFILVCKYVKISCISDYVRF